MQELTPDRFEILLAILLAAISGFTIRIMLTLVKQKWVATYHHTMSYILLPVITFTITKVITGNIALSLGMIGALSIVRFRNPVKNPFELVVFFALVTIGISMGVKIEYGILLAVVINGVILLSFLMEKLARRYGYQLYSLSFDEGNAFHTLEVTSSCDLPQLANNRLLLQYVYQKADNTRHYRLASRNYNELDGLRQELEQNDGVVHLETRYS
jgi:hypothetical protein